MERFAELYPPYADRMRVSTRLPVARFPDAVQIRNEKGVRSFYGDRLVGLYDVVGTDDRIGVVDKLFPHSRFDSMLLAANERVRSSVTDLAQVSLATVFEIAHGFVRYVSRDDVTAQFDLDGAEVHVCFNYDADTIDRENAMFYDKRFHLHLNCWPGHDLDSIDTVTYGSVSDMLARRRLMDPIAFLAPRIIRDLVGTSIAGHRLLVDPADVPGAPAGLKVRLPGWHALGEPSVPRLLRGLHEAAARGYTAIREAFVGAAAVPRPWTRPVLLPRTAIRANLDRIDWLSGESKAGLGVLVDALRDVTAEQMDVFRRDPVAAALRLTLAGLDYSIGLFSPRPHSAQARLIDTPEVILVMQCRLFGDVGGAGLPPLRGASGVRLDRRSGPVMTDDEVKQRVAFREGFIRDELRRIVADGRLRRIECER
jgi:hypothetical protein